MWWLKKMKADNTRSIFVCCWPGMGPWVTQCHWQDQCLVQMAYDSLELFRVVIIFNADKSIWNTLQFKKWGLNSAWMGLWVHIIFLNVFFTRGVCHSLCHHCWTNLFTVFVMQDWKDMGEKDNCLRLFRVNAVSQLEWTSSFMQYT